MRLSKSLVPTLREDPADAEAISHKLMLRAGLVRQLAAGIYVWLPLGQRVLDRINAIIREEMNAIGGQEMTMPVLHPAEIWRDSGRWDAIGPEMFRLKDRNDRDMCLAMTHEEVIAWLAAREIPSYRDLPQIWYQIQTKERGVPEAPVFPSWTREEVATPNARTIAEVAAFLKIDPRLTIKSLLFVAPKAGRVLVLVRGDHNLHERKLARALGEEARPGHPEEVLQHLNAPVGSVGPVGARVPILADDVGPLAE